MDIRYQSYTQFKRLATRRFLRMPIHLTRDSAASTHNLVKCRKESGISESYPLAMSARTAQRMPIHLMRDSAASARSLEECERESRMSGSIPLTWGTNGANVRGARGNLRVSAT